jgi:peptidoglycan/LPS O-acetylase OafA/YrhL
MPGLDVVRGVAIVAVLVDHGLSVNPYNYLAYHSNFMMGLLRAFQLGRMGVHLFFILSGFLITGILLNTREDADYYKNFYLRRVLRILPAYLLMLAVMIATHSISWRYLAVCLLYLCNMNALLGASPEYGPFWSLSVEEQFYLVWPFAVRKLSLRYLTVLAVGLVLLTPVLRFLLVWIASHPGLSFLQDVSNKPWALGDFFAAGALLCVASRTPAFRAFQQRLVWPLLIGGAILVSSYLLLPAPTSPVVLHLMRAIELEPWIVLFSGVVLFGFLYPKIAQQLWAKPLVFLGKISYGLYLCHLFLFREIDHFWDYGAPHSLGPFPRNLVRFIVEATVAIGVAALSRYTFEEFFLRLKPKHHHKAVSHNAQEKIA